MAKAESFSYEEQFSCSVCLDVLKEPVTIPCGHSYCMICINNFWSGLHPNTVHSCPQCREMFSPRPALKKNTLLAEVMEKMKSDFTLTDQAASSDQNISTCVKMECDFCIGAKNKADKFCLQCLASYCELHLQPHYQSPVFMKHKLVQASTQVQKNICPRHGKPLDIYCSDDQQCICYLCMVESHKDHKSSFVETERIKNQDVIEEAKMECQKMIGEREEGLMELTKAVTAIRCFAQTAEEDNEALFTELIASLKRRCSEVKTLIRAQEMAELSRADALCQRLDHELTELRTKMTEIQELLSTKDHIHFMRSYASVRALPVFNSVPSITCVTRETCENASISGVKEQLEDVCHHEVERISKEVINIRVVEPETREDFLQYFCDLHVDPNTINTSLVVSEDGRSVTQDLLYQLYPDHPERFDIFAHFLCKERLDGRHYWEVDCLGNDWSIAVAYKGIKRKGGGNESRLGFNAKSWRFSQSSQGCYFRHDQTVINLRQISLAPIGVYLNHRAGTLSFYSASCEMILLHKVKTKFTEPLYAGFGVGGGSEVRIRDRAE